MAFITLLSAAFLAIGSTQEGARVSARISNTSAAVGETIVYEIVVEGADGAVEIGTPAFPSGLLLRGTQDFTEMHFSIPGGRRQSRRREFVLQAAAPGRARIAPVVVLVGNARHRTNAVEVLVSGTAQPRSFASTEDAWLRATMTPETVYVGQQSTLTIEAGLSEDVRMRLTRPPVFEPPAPTGFWVQEVPGGVQSTLRSVNGRITEIQTLQRAYFPLSPGRFAFAPARAILDVREGFLFAPETREIRSSSPRVTVLALPERGKPHDFKGAVGSYTVRAFVQPDTVAVGEAAELTIEIVGTGNIKAAPPPILPVIRGVEQYAPTEATELAFDRSLVRGTKRFQWVIIPTSAGRIDIPAVSYSFFDPGARAYRTIATTPVFLTARASLASRDEDGAGTTTLSALRPAPRSDPLWWVRTPAFLWAQLIPVMVLLAVVARARLRRRTPRSSAAFSELKAAASAHTSYSEFLRTVENIVRGAAADRTRDATLRTAAAPALANALRSDGVGEMIIARVVGFIERVETERYAPSGSQSAERHALAEEAEALLRLLMRATNRHGATPAAYALLLMFQVPNANPFAQGVELYRNGQFAPAVRAFESAIAADSNDVAAWANLGHAYFRAGDRGHAVWAWARAARMAPRDRALTRNLQAAGAVEVLRTRPPLSVRPAEWYLLAALAWWVAAGIGIAALIRQRTAMLSWTLPAIVVMVIGLSVGAFADGHHYAVAVQDATHLYGDPTIHSPVVRTVQGGAGLDVLERREDWLRVRTVTQAEGWVEADAVGTL